MVSHRPRPVVTILGGAVTLDLGQAGVGGGKSRLAAPLLPPPRTFPGTLSLQCGIDFLCGFLGVKL